MKQSNATLIFRYFFVDSLGGIILFPLWWYGRGLTMMIEWTATKLKFGWQFMAVSVWMKNLFNPMYGETGFAGRLISFFIRSFMIFFRSIGFLFWALIVFTVLVIYLLIIPVIVIGLVYHGLGSVI